MRILIDICVFELRNKGNIAMLQTAVKRFREFWPDASIEVLTLTPLLSKYYLPDCTPVNPYRQQTSLGRNLLQKFFRFVPAVVWRLVFQFRDAIRQFRAHRANIGTHKAAADVEPIHQVGEVNWVKVTGSAGGDAPAQILDALDPQFLSGIDLFVGAGGHYLSDASKDNALQTLDRLEQAIRQGIPTALVGQGMGPFEDQELLRKTMEVLPKVDLVLIREKKFAPHFLNSIHVPSNRVILTGDDAIEMAYHARSDSGGNVIGIGIRVAPSSEVNVDNFQVIRPVLDLVTMKYHASFLPLPISDSMYEAETDGQAIRKLLADHLSPSWHERPYLYPIDIIRLVGKCGIVVTGAFHPAVFALAQGIPVICLAKSAHYSNKLSGLADMFKDGCQVIMLDDENVKEKLADSIDFAWTHRQELKSQLLESARHQIEWGHAGYQRISDLVESRKVTR